VIVSRSQRIASQLIEIPFYSCRLHYALVYKNPQLSYSAGPLGIHYRPVMVQIMDLSERDLLYFIEISKR